MCLPEVKRRGGAENKAAPGDLAKATWPHGTDFSSACLGIMDMAQVESWWQSAGYAPLIVAVALAVAGLVAAAVNRTLRRRPPTRHQADAGDSD